MKTWHVVKNGAPGQALALQDAPDPVALADNVPLKGSNVLVRVSYAALNPADLEFMLNIPNWLPFRHNPIPGLDFAGEIVKLGPTAAAEPAHAAAPLAVGAHVCGCLSVSLVFFGNGALAEYVTVPAELLTRVPKGLNMEAAVGMLGCAGQTAQLIMADAGALEATVRKDLSQATPRVLVNGASGSVGSLVVQIAKARGAHVVGVCSAANAALVQRLGADEVVDYSVHDPLPAYLATVYSKTAEDKDASKQAPFDLIVDCVGNQPLFSQCSPYLVPHGTFLSIVGGPTQGVVPFVRNKMLPCFLGGISRMFKILALAPAGQRGRAMAEMFSDGSIKEMPIDSVYSMADVIKAYEKLATKRSKGKIIIKVQE